MLFCGYGHGPVLKMRKSNEQPRESRAYQRTNYRYSGVAPAGASLPAERKERMDDAGPEVARRIDRITGGPTQRQADCPDQDSHQLRPEAGDGAADRDLLREDHGNTQEEHKRANNFAEQVRPEVLNRGHG